MSRLYILWDVQRILSFKIHQNGEYFFPYCLNIYLGVLSLLIFISQLTIPFINIIEWIFSTIILLNTIVYKDSFIFFKIFFIIFG